MLLFLASVIEQLDLALEHINEANVNDARFGLMLTDNALELVLHQIAKEKASDLRFFNALSKVYEHQAALDKALGRSFEAKLKFAKIEKGLSEEDAQTITILHDYRNTVYHVGLSHEAILPALSRFYFDVTCSFLMTYRPGSLGWGSNLRIPERSKKYFSGRGSMPGDFDDFPKACASLKASCNHDANSTISVLSDDLDGIISQQDVCLDIVARGVYKGQQTTRDAAVVETQAWRLAFSDDVRAFAFEQGFKGSILDLIEWLKANYPLHFKGDPIPSWQRRAAKIRASKNPHRALSNYQSFISSTEDVREAIEASAAAAEREIDRLIDEARGK